MKQAENKAKKRELFMLIRRLKERLYDKKRGPDSIAQKRAAWEEVFRKGKELGLAERSYDWRQFKKNCVDNTIRQANERLLRQKKLRECGREVAMNTLDEVVLDVIGRDTEQKRATRNDRESDTCNRLSEPDVPELVEETILREQLKQMGFATNTNSVGVEPVELDGAEPMDRVVTVDVAEPADEAVVVVDGAVPVDGTVPVDGAQPVDLGNPMDGVMAVDVVFSDDYLTLDIDSSSRPTSVTGDEHQTPTFATPGARTCTICGTHREPGPSPSVRLGGGPDLNTARRRPCSASTGGIDRRALAAEYRALLARPDEERTDEERAKVQKILTLRLLERLVGDSNSTASDLRRLTALVLAMLG